MGLGTQPFIPLGSALPNRGRVENFSCMEKPHRATALFTGLICLLSKIAPVCFSSHSPFSPCLLHKGGTSDYESWTPSDGSDPSSPCWLGRELVYSRRIRNANCFNDQDYDHLVSSTACQCTIEDYEWYVYGKYDIFETITLFVAISHFHQIPRPAASHASLQEFFLQTHLMIVLALTFLHKGNMSMLFCYLSNLFLFISYRQVPGDGCQEGLNLLPINRTCPIVPPRGPGPESKTWIVVVVIVVVLVVMVIVVFVVFRHPEYVSCLFLTFL